jgi:murein DD-endopeptidase MepM/ murein hydrolase activator NlpD
MNNERVDGFAVLALAFLFFLGFQIISDRATTQPAMAMDEVSLEDLEAAPLQTTDFIDYSVIGQPYEDYYLTQGSHGFSYGHNAIDISAGKGAEILSPISGMVVANFVDELGNPTLILENEIWQITLMHGEYILSTGEQVSLSQVVGYESNLGYTTDMQGRSCQGRDCGYHTHLNIYDKRISANINPMDVLQP